MTVPSRAEACRLLLSLRPPERLLEHSTVAAEVAAFLARAAAKTGQRVDRGVAEGAALLHDLDKALPESHWRGLDHGRAGAAWLREHGYAELAQAMEHHPVTRLTDDELYAAWWRDASLEARIVAYADKRALQRLVPMATRFRDWARRYPDNADRQRKGRERAERLEQQVCAAAGVEPREVRRLRWVADALETAQ